MKNDKKVLSILCSAIMIMTVVTAIVIYQNGREGVDAAKKYAEAALRKVAEQAINKEYEALNLPFSISLSMDKEYSNRRFISEDGVFIVVIDSLKESQALYSLKTIGYKLQIIEIEKHFSFDKVLSAWKEELEAKYSSVKCALYFKKTLLNGSGGSEYCLGDTSVCSSKYALNTYYVDCMYTTTLTAYYALTSVKQYIDWGAFEVVLTLCLWILLLIGLLFFLFLKYSKGRVNVKDIANDTPNESSNDNPVIVTIFEKYTLNVIKRTLSYQEQEIVCSPQICDLLYAFALATDYFLSNEEIVSVCGWDLLELSVNDRRRKAISQMNLLLKKTIKLQAKSVSDRKGYQLCELS